MENLGVAVKQRRNYSDGNEEPTNSNSKNGRRNTRGAENDGELGGGEGQTGGTGGGAAPSPPAESRTSDVETPSKASMAAGGPYDGDGLDRERVSLQTSSSVSRASSAASVKSCRDSRDLRRSLDEGGGGDAGFGKGCVFQ